ncbi:MAG: GumC family protein [Cyanophyceae cyanobacterium]
MSPPIVKRFLIALEENKLLGLLVFLLCLGVSGIVALQPPPPEPRPVFRATGALAPTNATPAFTSTGNQLQERGKRITQSMLLAPRVLREVSEQLDIAPQEMRSLLQNKLIIDFPAEESESNQITLNYNDANPEEAEIVLETFMDEMIEYSRWLNTSQLRTRIEALEERLTQVQQDLIAAEETFYRYISGEGSSLLAVQDGSLFNGITNSQRRQRDLRVALEGIDGEISTLVAQLGLTPEQAYTSAALSADPIISNLRSQLLNLELQLERLRQDYKPEAPRVVDLRKQQRVTEQLLQQRASEVIGDDGILTPLPRIRQESNLDPARRELANRLIALQSQRENLIQQLQTVEDTELGLRQQYEQFPDKQVEQARLVQAVESQRILYQTILSALVDARSAEAETLSSLATAQPPTVSRVRPNPPPDRNPVLIIGAGAGVGVLAAAGVLFLLATVDDRLHTEQELQQVLSEREVLLLGQLPFILSYDDWGRETPILLDSDSNYLSFYERVRSNIRRLGEEPAKVVLVTSASDGEGKSVSAYNLAIASAHAGKRTLLIEADLRSPSKAQSLNVEPDSEARIEPLRYYASRSDSITLVPEVENLYVLPSCGPQRQAAAIIESSELQRLLRDARGRFDMVIIDSPSLSRCNDALLLEPLTDGLVLVTRPGTTRSSLLGEAIEQFIEAELPLLGAVINDVDTLVSPSELVTEEPETTEEDSVNPPVGTRA